MEHKFSIVVFDEELKARDLTNGLLKTLSLTYEFSSTPGGEGWNGRYYHIVIYSESSFFTELDNLAKKLGYCVMIGKDDGEQSWLGSKKSFMKYLSFKMNGLTTLLTSNPETRRLGELILAELQ